MATPECDPSAHPENRLGAAKDCWAGYLLSIALTALAFAAVALRVYYSCA